jgi:ribosomal protein L16 Arg81 hydroxylase
LPLTTLPVTIPVANDIPVAAAAALPAPGLDQEVISEQVANRVQEMIESLVSSQAPNQQADLNENLIKKIESSHEEKVNALNSLLQQKERELSANNANINLMKQRIIDLVNNEKILNGYHPVLTNKTIN